MDWVTNATNWHSRTVSIEVPTERPSPEMIEQAFRIACSRVLGTVTEPQDWPVFYRGSKEKP